jgi:hypothetical protein
LIQMIIFFVAYVVSHVVDHLVWSSANRNRPQSMYANTMGPVVSQSSPAPPNFRWTSGMVGAIEFAAETIKNAPRSDWNLMARDAATQMAEEWGRQWVSDWVRVSGTSNEQLRRYLGRSSADMTTDELELAAFRKACYEAIVSYF